MTGGLTPAGLQVLGIPSLFEDILLQLQTPDVFAYMRVCRGFRNFIRHTTHINIAMRLSHPCTKDPANTFAELSACAQKLGAIKFDPEFAKRFEFDPALVNQAAADPLPFVLYSEVSRVGSTVPSSVLAAICPSLYYANILMSKAAGLSVADSRHEPYLSVKPFNVTYACLSEVNQDLTMILHTDMDNRDVNEPHPVLEPTASWTRIKLTSHAAKVNVIVITKLGSWGALDCLAEIWSPQEANLENLAGLVARAVGFIRERQERRKMYS
jgi:hypothetical protein